MSGCSLIYTNARTITRSGHGRKYREMHAEVLRRRTQESTDTRSKQERKAEDSRTFRTTGETHV